MTNPLCDFCEEAPAVAVRYALVENEGEGDPLRWAACTACETCAATRGLVDDPTNDD